MNDPWPELVDRITDTQARNLLITLLGYSRARMLANAKGVKGQKDHAFPPEDLPALKLGWAGQERAHNDIQHLAVSRINALVEANPKADPAKLPAPVAFRYANRRYVGQLAYLKVVNGIDCFGFLLEGEEAVTAFPMDHVEVLKTYPFKFRTKTPEGNQEEFNRWGGEERKYLVYFRDAGQMKDDDKFSVVAYCVSPELAERAGDRWVQDFGGEYRVIEAEIVRPGDDHR